MRRTFFLLFAVALTPATQAADLAAVGAAGFAGGEGAVHGTYGGGASIGFPYAGKHRIQFDYLFIEGRVEDSPRRQFITASYVVQRTVGRARPFLQAGGGVAVSRPDSLVFPVADPILRTAVIERGHDPSFAVVFGAGVTIDLGTSLFLRPQVRLYGHVGPTFTVLPSVAFGFRF